MWLPEPRQEQTESILACLLEFLRVSQQELLWGLGQGFLEAFPMRFGGPSLEWNLQRF